MADALLTVFWGVLVLVILVVIHELGHFIAARKFGARVTEFMIGMPGPNIGFERNGCRYGVTCIPLGGYNRITGMEGGPEDPNLEAVLAYVHRHGSTDPVHVAAGCSLSDEDAEFALTVLDGWGSINKPGRSNPTGKWCAPKTPEYALGEAREVEDPKALLDFERTQTYRGLSFGKRLVVLFAGPLMNVLLALICFLVAFCGIGVSYSTTIIDSLVDGAPIAEAGLQPGDKITSVNGIDVAVLSDVSTALQGCEAGDVVAVEYERNGVDAKADVTLGTSDDGRVIVGFIAKSDRYHMGPVEALKTSWLMLVTTVGAYASLFNPSTAADTLSQSSSIVGISVMAKQAAGAGLFSFLYILGAVSLSLGIVNLLPIPPLDGGKIVTECIEKAIRRPVPVSVINFISIAFIALMLILFVYMTRQDILNFIL